MNEDYLWDKTGEADEETAQLERKLGRLGFKPSAHPLPLPAHAPRAVGLQENIFSRTFAIAATLLILLLAGGLWLGLRRSNSGDNKLVAETTPETKQEANAFSGPRPPIGPIETTGASAIENPESSSRTSETTATARSKFKSRAASAERRRQLIAVQIAQREARARRLQQLAREGEAAKAQLIKALHITSDALDTVQRKIQGDEERRPIS